MSFTYCSNGLHVNRLVTMANGGLVFDALVQPRHLPRLLALHQRHPALKVVIDHCAKPDIAHGQWQPWAEDMARLARETPWACKLSGLLTECGPAPRPDAARRLVAPGLRRPQQTPGRSPAEPITAPDRTRRLAASMSG